MHKTIYLFLAALFISINIAAQQTNPADLSGGSLDHLDALKFRNIGPFRGGRSNAAVGVIGDPMTYYFGSTGGGVWKTENAGITWKNISDGFFKSGSVGAIAVAPGDKNVVYVGMGEHAVRGVMTSHGDGVYKSTDAGQTWKHIGLPNSRHIARIEVHPADPDHVYVAVQGALWEGSDERGIYESKNGGKTWSKILFINKNTGAADLSMDPSNPRILYAAMWDHQRLPWKVRSGGEGSGIWKSTDGGQNWEQLKKGLPEKMGKVAVAVSPANPQRVYANIEAEKGGVFRSDDGGKSWQQVNSQRVTVTRAWYYIKIFADPVNPDLVYVLNAQVLKSADGGKTFQPVQNPHGDQHYLWINPGNPKNMVLANDGGACITFNGGQNWTTENNQPTAQFYRAITDRRFPYHIYGGQQDNTTVCIASRTMGGYIGERDWYPVAGGESAFLAFDPDDPQLVYGNSIQGFTDVYDHKTKTVKDIMAYPQFNLGTLPKDMRYRFNWNNPLVAQIQNPGILYQGAQKVLRTADDPSRNLGGGYSWTEISPDLTRNDASKHGDGGEPYTNEAAGGEVYNTISYIAPSPHSADIIWVGSDDGLLHLTMDGGASWNDITPYKSGESLVNAIEPSSHELGTAYVAVTRYKFGDLRPYIYKTDNFGESWKLLTSGLPKDNFVRVVREDPRKEGLLYAGTEHGLYISFNGGRGWSRFQSNLPVCPITDLCIADNDLVVATSGRAFWILDDLGALQQGAAEMDKGAFHIFQPKDTYKFTINANPKPSPLAGQNPPNGVIFDYHLPGGWADSMSLKLEVLDGQGQAIRTFFNKKNKETKGRPGGPPPPQVLPAKAGLNRFNWDLRTETMPGIEGVFVLGDYRGHLVAPGTYTLRLSTEKETVETSVKVLPDPRLSASPNEHLEQQKMLEQIAAAVKEIHRSVIRLRNIKSQLKARLDLLEKMDGQEELVKKGKAAEKAITAWEEQLIQPKQETFQDVINFRNMLSSELLNLKSGIDAHVPKPTEGQKERLADLLKTWEGLELEMTKIIDHEIGGFNKMYGAAGLPALILPEEE
ncbi:MAG TPA: glycosyl hydrolase [Bacteroidetes bacterium]|nr:glycosyl hydrolase [Bacteroidota bacterium]